MQPGMKQAKSNKSIPIRMIQTASTKTINEIFDIAAIDPKFDWVKTGSKKTGNLNPKSVVPFLAPKLTNQ